MNYVLAPDQMKIQIVIKIEELDQNQLLKLKENFGIENSYDLHQMLEHINLEQLQNLYYAAENNFEFLNQEDTVSKYSRTSRSSCRSGT